MGRVMSDLWLTEDIYAVILNLLGKLMHYHLEKIHISETKTIQDTSPHEITI